MIARTRSLAVTMTWAAAVGLVVLALAVSPTHRSIGEMVVASAYQLFTTVGVVITIRRPRHPIGPLFLFSGVASALQGLAEALVERGQAHHDLTSFTVHAAAWAQTWLWLPTLAVPLVFVLLLFPDGRLPSPRWRPVFVAGLAGVALVVVPFGLVSLALPTRELVRSQPHVHGWQAAVFALAYVGVLTCLVCACAGVASLVVRFRRGTGEVRQQIKVVLFAAALAVVAVVLGSVFGSTQNVLEPLGTALIAASVAVAVLRYRLFDIDRIISRTVSYLVVTGLLVGVYVGCVALLTSLLSFGSSVGVAASTLAAAALFQPARRRVQHSVDRRFNRERYDAARTIDAFASRLRDEIDPDLVRADLLTVAATVIQPRSVSLWVAS
ncbi:MAG TPA: hypothetical protein VFT62_08840 [Mycobacteriales bacterium]|nr:hypothetical protein [Mycobacteriales bacterium]